MNAFVTGSTGLLGFNLVRNLVTDGHKVKALARSIEKAEKVLGDLDVTIIEGDMLNVADFAHHMAECNVLFHVAAFSPLYLRPGDEERLQKINEEGTINLLSAAIKNKVSEVIYVSTIGVLDTNEGRIDEATPFNYSTPNPAWKNKIAVEEAINRFLNTNDLAIKLVLPSAMLGPGDSVPTPVGQSVIDYLDGKTPGILPGGFWFVDARDVALAMIRSVGKGSKGERYIVAGNYYPVEAFLKTLEKVSGVQAPTRRIPYFVAQTFAWVAELQSRLTGQPPQITVAGLKALVEKPTFSSQKAIEELGISFRPLENTLRDQIKWFGANGYTSHT